MTIYALVNDFITPTDDLRPIWTLMSPAAILQGGNPYFVPDFASRFEARPALALRIGKLGKGIARRFAARYVDGVAPAAVFAATDLLHRLRAEGLPWTAAVSYDRSLAIGKFKPMPFEEIPGCEFSLTLESGDLRQEKVCRTDHSTITPESAIETISRDNTLKTGDIILIGASATGHIVKPDLKATLRLNGEESLRFNIR